MDETDRRRIAALTAPISRTTFYRIGLFVSRSLLSPLLMSTTDPRQQSSFSAGLKSADDLASISSLRV
jgi:hypothetical protein